MNEVNRILLKELEAIFNMKIKKSKIVNP